MSIIEDVKKLNKSHRDKLPQYIDKWKAISTSTDLCDREKAEFFAKSAYGIQGLTAPDLVIWTLNPLECAMAMELFRRNSELFESGKLSNQEIQSLIEEGVKDKAQFTKEQICSMLNDQSYGLHEAGWLAFYDFFSIELDSEDAKKFSPLIELAKNCGWWAAYDTVIFLQEKPKVFNVLMETLHDERGPVISYRGTDDLDIYFLNGVRVPSEVVLTPPDVLDPSLLLRDSWEGFNNVHEIRSEILKKIGAAKALKALGATLEERLTGEEAYTVYPIAEYRQAGDVLCFPGKLDISRMSKDNIVPVNINEMKSSGKSKDEIINELKKQEKYILPIFHKTDKKFQDLCKKMKIRLVNGVFYELYRLDLKGVKVKMLRMGNPSVLGEEHVEFVGEECENVYQSILYRNYSKFFNWGHTEIKQIANMPDVGLPCILS